MASKTPIILLCGNAGVGKDTAASLIKSNVKSVSSIAFADPIKCFANEFLNINKDILYGPSELRKELVTVPTSQYSCEVSAAIHLNIKSDNLWHKHFHYWNEENRGKVKTVRSILQELGDIGRTVDKNFWINIGVEKAFDLLNDYNYSIITDGRYRNEILSVKKINGLVVKIEGIGTLKDNFHSSETEFDSVPDHFFDVIVHNDKSKGTETLKADLKVLTSYYYGALTNYP